MSSSDYISSITVISQNFFKDWSIVVGSVLIVILSLLAALLGLGWAVRSFTKNLGFDRSFTVGGYYVWKLPYKGYKRFHSQKWNAENN